MAGRKAWLILKDSKGGDFYVQRRTQLANRLPITGPPRVAVLNLTGESPAQNSRLFLAGSGPKFKIKTDVLLQLYIK